MSKEEAMKISDFEKLAHLTPVASCKRIVGMVVFGDELIVATEDGVWIKRGDGFVEMTFVEKEGGEVK